MERARSGQDAARPGKVWAGEVLVLALLLAGTGCAATRPAVVRASELPLAKAAVEPRAEPEPEPEPSEPRPAASSYVVQPGDTLWRIARSHGISLEELARANEIEDPSRVETGRSLTIPGRFAAGSAWDTSVLSWPVRRGRILSRFGDPRAHRAHRGLDIGGEHGEPVLAAESGRVVYSGSSLRGYGKTVILDHGDRLQTLYAHNAELLVRVGQLVARGQAVALLGRTGNASTDHCHFEVRNKEVSVDPLHYLPDLAGLR